MKKILLVFLLMILSSPLFAAPRYQLDDGNGNILGTNSSNPIHVSCVSGCGGGTGSPGGSNTQVQYNQSGNFGGITGATTDGTTLTLVAPILGTPASVVLTNATGTASSLTAGSVSTINGLITNGSNITISGSGTSGSPYSIASSAGGSGTVTSVSIASANGISGSVANSTTTPAITINPINNNGINWPNFDAPDYNVPNSVWTTNAAGNGNWSVNVGSTNASNSWDLSNWWNLIWRPGDTQVVNRTYSSESGTVANGYVFLGDNQTPCHVIRYKEDDLTSTTSATLGSGTDGNCKAMTFDKNNDMIYAETNNGDVYQINPLTMVNSKVISNTFSGPNVGITNDGTSLYLVQSSDSPAVIYKYLISTFAQTATLSITGYNTAQSILYDGVNLYATGIPSPAAWIAQVNPSSFSSFTATALTGCTVAGNETAIAPDYIYVPCETSSTMAIVNKSTLGFTLLSLPNPSYGFWWSGQYVWGTEVNNTNYLFRLEPLTQQILYFTLPSGFSAPQTNKIYGDGNRIFVTNWNTGSGSTQLGRLSTMGLPASSITDNLNLNVNGNISSTNTISSSSLSIGSNAFTVTPGGAVGIGTFSTNLFQVGSNASVSAGGLITASQINLTNFSGTNTLEGSYLFEGAGINLSYGTPDILSFGGMAVASSDYIEDNSGTTHDLYIGTNGSNRVDINASGNVGIGSMNPGNLLDVAGTTRQKGFVLSGNGAASGYILQSSGSLGIGTWVPAPSGGGGSSQWTGTAGSNIYYSGANVGIGTSLSTNVLDVAGGVSIGTTYAGYRNAPANGVTVQGNVGIGTWIPQYSLNVIGNVGIGTSTIPQTLLVTNTGALGIGTFNPALSTLDIFQQPTAAYTDPVTSGNNYAVRIVGSNYNPPHGGAGLLGALEVIGTQNGGSFNNIFTVGNTAGATIFNIDANETFTLNADSGLNLNPAGSFGAPLGLTVTNTSGFGSSNPYLGAIANNGSLFAGESPGGVNATGYLENTGNGPLLFETNSTEYMRIAANGNVGVGTFSPIDTFSVMGGNVGIGTTAVPEKLHMFDSGGVSWHCAPAPTTGVFTCTSP